MKKAIGLTLLGLSILVAVLVAVKRCSSGRWTKRVKKPFLRRDGDHPRGPVALWETA